MRKAILDETEMALDHDLVQELHAYFCQSKMNGCLFIFYTPFLVEILS